MIRIEDISHRYTGRRGQPGRLALDALSMEVPAGAFCVLSGPNGSGKSTLFRLLCGLARPSAGKLWLTLPEGQPIDIAADPAAARAHLGVVFQSPAVDRQLSVAENLAIHADLYGLKGAERQARRDEALAWTDLANRLNERVETLSGGLMRQVELAKVLMTRPSVLLLDEPTSGLDPASRRAFIKALTTLKEERGLTVLMTSHVFSEAGEADSVAILCDGRLLAHDTPRNLKSRVGREMVVVEPAEGCDLQALAGDLAASAPDIPPRVYGEEIRLEDLPPGRSVALIKTILENHRHCIAGVAVREPSLEDVFVHVTGKGLPDAPDSPPTSQDERAA
ncbi:ABC transporter ATP-binding protein [Roseospirillum parvum]|uniref:ABC-2 type transport system ATP-binding protein n=1 Tax=Roseospirillum parvum TaxID=83401 RepID=A0A1G7W1Y5_9PROT|nr:ABC transporter ATP-binding protein [Roseospirillum parvum]SDG65987.1 ABC-2 type transport system ATP-binding protein [Roseospirillum parvum]